MTGIKRTDPARDWTEDFAHENGRYQSRCYRCGEHFQGYKRRVVCRLCDSAVSAPIDPAPEAGAVVPWVKTALAVLDAYELDLGDKLPDDHELGRIDESRGSSSFSIRVGHIRQLAAAPLPPPVSPEVVGKLVEALRIARGYIADDVKRNPSEYDPSVDLKRVDAALSLVGEGG